MTQTASTFNPHDHIIVLERKSKKRDANGNERWETTKTEYLPVAWRLFWFRTENPIGKITSKLVHLDATQGIAVFETEVVTDKGGTAVMHGSETATDWKDYLEKAQTKSLGRALAACGYGSQFSNDDFDEGERICDTPVPASTSAPEKPHVAHDKGRDRLSSSLDNAQPAPAKTGVPQEVKDRLNALYARGKELGKFNDTKGFAQFASACLVQTITEAGLTKLSQQDMQRIGQMLVGEETAA